MDYLALALAIIAALIFALSGEIRIGARVITNIALGLFFLTLALICQFTEITGSVWVNH